MSNQQERTDELLKAALQLNDAKEKERAAEADVTTAEQQFAIAPAHQKTVAQEKLRAAQEKLEEARRTLQLEQKQLAFLTQGPPHFGITNVTSIGLQYVVFGILALVMLIFLMYGIVGNQVLLPSLASISVSRGLITFVIAVVTVTIALILVLATVVSDSQDRARRFMQGKEVLTMLIGVLGTIVGFYFGNTSDGIKTLEVLSPYISNENPVGGEPLDITSFISGGKAPYLIDVTFSPDKPETIAPVAKSESTDGSIRLIGLKTNTVDKPVRISFQIKVRDGEGRTVVYDSATRGKYLEVKPSKHR